MSALSKKERVGHRIRTRPPGICPYCERPTEFFHQCRYCDFYICQQCAKDNDKIFSCNSVTWQCIDCGKSNSF